MLRISCAAMALALLVHPAAAQQTDPAQAPDGRYRLETAHSQVLFSILHLGLTDYYGRFDQVSGDLTFDGKHPEKSAVAVSIGVDSIDTTSDRLNGELESTFDTAKFPDATFKSTAIVRSGPNNGHIIGMLTLHGVTRPVTLDATFNGGAPSPMTGDYMLGFRATATIKRSDFGLTGMPWEGMVSDDVKLVIEALFQQEKE